MLPVAPLLPRRRSRRNIPQDIEETLMHTVEDLVNLHWQDILALNQIPPTPNPFDSQRILPFIRT